MAVSNEVETCLRERLANEGSMGPIFASGEAHEDWLFGSSKGSPAFIDDPKAALETTLHTRQGARHPHVGVTVSAADASELRRAVKALHRGSFACAAGSLHVLPAALFFGFKIGATVHTW